MSVSVPPGYIIGTWNIDPSHSEVGFTARHLGIAKVRGSFEDFEATVVTAENPLESSVTATIKTASISSRSEARDGHVRGADFLNVEEYPEMTFTSTGIRADGEDFLLDGDLTLRGVTRPVTLSLEVNGFAKGIHGENRVGFSASTEINRSDFGIHGGPSGAVVSEKIIIKLEAEGTLADD